MHTHVGCLSRAHLKKQQMPVFFQAKNLRKTFCVLFNNFSLLCVREKEKDFFNY